MKKRFVTFFMACLMAFSCTAFAAETSGEISPRTDGYTYKDHIFFQKFLFSLNPNKYIRLFLD